MEALGPFDATPRMKPATAARLVAVVERAMESGMDEFPVTPAIGVYIWHGSLVKEVVNEVDALETIRRLEAAIAESAGRES